MERNGQTKLPPDLVALIWQIADSSGGGAPGGGGASILFQPGLPSNGNRVASWAEVQTAITSAHGALTVFVDSSLAPAVVTAGTTTDMTRVTLQGAPATIGHVLQIPDTAVLQNLAWVEGTLSLQPHSVTGPCFSNTRFNNLILRDGATIALAVGTTVSPFQTIGAGGAQAITFVDGGVFSNVGAPTIPLISLTGNAVFTITNLSDSNATLVPVNIVAGTGATTLNFISDDTLPLPAFTGMSGTIVYTPISKALGEFYDDTLVAVALGSSTVQGAIDLLKNSPKQSIAVTTTIAKNRSLVDVTVNATAIVTIGTGVQEIVVKDRTTSATPTIPITTQGGVILLEDPNNLGVVADFATTVYLKQPGGAVTFRYNGTIFEVVGST